jgi:chromosome segregation ATPase
MEDVIFAGSDSEKALGFAEVSYALQQRQKDTGGLYGINIMRRIVPVR